MKKIVIVGGGFGGVYTAQNLRKMFRADEVKIILINKNDYFLFTPLLHEVATGNLSSDSIIESLPEIFCKKQIQFIKDTVTHIDLKSNQITLSNQAKLDYDYLVLATGAQTNYYDIPGAFANTLGLKNLDDAILIKKNLVQILRKERPSIVIVGGGPTSVEMAGELSDGDAVVTLISSNSKLLKQFSPFLQDQALKILQQKKVKIILNSSVNEVRAESVVLNDMTVINSDLTIWSAGVIPEIPNFLNGDVLLDNGRIKIDSSLRLKEFQNIFVLGDLAASFPMLAQAAVQEAKVVAQNIFALIRFKPVRHFQYKSAGELVSLGKFQAVGQVLGLKISGIFAWWLWRTVYLFKFLAWKKRLKIALEWTINLFSTRDLN